MPNLDHKCDHEENRKKVCAPCGKKIVFGKKKSDFYHITDKYANLIKIFINKDFSTADPRFPLSICGTCRNTLLEHEKNDFKRPLQSMPNYKDIMLPKVTRANNGNDVCNCYVCLTGRNKGHVQAVQGKGNIRNLCNQIDASNGLFGSSTNIEQLPLKPKKGKDEKIYSALHNLLSRNRKRKITCL